MLKEIRRKIVERFNNHVKSKDGKVQIKIYLENIHYKRSNSVAAGPAGSSDGFNFCGALQDGNTGNGLSMKTFC